MMSLAAMSYLTSVYLQSVTGREPLAAALLGIPMAIAVFVCSMGGARVGHRLGVRSTFVLALLAHGVVGLRSVFVDYVHTRARLVAAELLVRGSVTAFAGPEQGASR